MLLFVLLLVLLFVLLRWPTLGVGRSPLTGGNNPVAGPGEAEADAPCCGKLFSLSQLNCVPPSGVKTVISQAGPVGCIPVGNDATIEGLVLLFFKLERNLAKPPAADANCEAGGAPLGEILSASSERDAKEVFDRRVLGSGRFRRLVGTTQSQP